MIGVASELGQEVDEVMATTTGKLILAVVLWKVIGTDLVQLIAGFMWFVIFLPLWWRMFRRYGENYEEKYEDGKLVSRRNGKTSVEAAWTFGIALIIIVGGGLILTFV